MMQVNNIAELNLTLLLLIMKKISILLASLLFVSAASARQWVNKSGKKIEAEFVSVVGNKVLLKKGSKTYSVTLDSLSQADQDWIQKQAKEKADKEKAIANGDFKLGGVKINRGGLTVVEYDLPEEDMDGFRKPNREHSKRYKILIYTPKSFNPLRKDYRIMLTSATSSGRADQAGSVHPFKQGIDQDWVVMTVDSTRGRPPEFSNNYRRQMLTTGMRQLHKEWPASKQWKMALAGHSGGAKSVQFLAHFLKSKKLGIENKLIGLYLTGVNQAFMGHVKLSAERMPSRIKPKIKIFISSGKKDTVATPAQHRMVEKLIKKAGFRRTRLEYFDGVHDEINQAHVKEGFKWISDELK